MFTCAGLLSPRSCRCFPCFRKSCFLFWAVSCMWQWGSPFLHPQSLNLFWGKLFGTSKVHWGQVFFSNLTLKTKTWAVTLPFQLTGGFYSMLGSLSKQDFPGLILVFYVGLPQTKLWADTVMQRPPRQARHRPSPFAILPAFGTSEPAGLGMLSLWGDHGPLVGQNALTRGVLL